MNLCIAIPTYNRAKRLDRALSELLEHIQNSNCKQKLSVFVSNNGSTDTTAEVIRDYEKKFSSSGVKYFYENLNKNHGFDFNVLNCYDKSPNGFVWFLSDDDNLSHGAIDEVYKDVSIRKVSFLYYNFDQEPYGKDKPYVRSSSVFDGLKPDGIDAILKVLTYPKVSSLWGR
jgi:abequosyltransferase